MQVADSMSVVSALSRYSAQISVAMLHVSQKQQIVVREVKQISEYGLRALAYVAGSTLLSKQEKRTLTRLIALVDEFAGGSPKLMNDIIGIAKIMEMSAKQTYKPQPLREALEEYFEEREKLDPSKEVIISVETEINAISVQYTGMTTEVALAQTSEAAAAPAL